MNRKNNMVLGVIFVVVGLLFLLKNMDILKLPFDIFDVGFLISTFWATLFIIIPGLVFHYAFFSNNQRDPGLLVPGGILLVTGINCQISSLFNIWHIMWPGFILAVAFGLFELYVYGHREKGLLIPVGILGGLSLLFFSTFSLRQIFNFSAGRIVIPVLLIIIGLVITFNGRGRGSNI